MGDLIGALAGYIGGKDARVTGQIAALPVYKGKLEKPPADKPKELTEKQKQLNAYLSKYKSGGDGGGEEQRKKKKRKVRKGEEPGRGLKIIDEDRGLGGISLAKAKGALRVSDEELSDERAVTVEEEELEALKAAADREKNFSSVQVDDGGSGGTNWVTVDQDGNIVNDAAKSKSASAADRDLSPPRRRGGGVGGGNSADQSPPRRTGGGIKRRAGDSESDQSPPRARAAAGRGGARRHDSDSDASPPRRRVPSGDRDQSPPRRVRGDAGRHDSDSDEGIVRAPRGEDGASKGDASPPRRRRHDSDSDDDDAAKNSVNTRTVNGLKAGFVSGQELRDTMEKKKEKESERFNKLDDAVTGKVAETVYRGKGGKRVDPTERRNADQADEEAMKNMVWGKGLVQQEEQLALKKRIAEEASKPFARTIDDKELNAELKQVSRWGDPMAGKLQGKTASNRPKYRGPFPPNRYGIAPGYRWDGVDRSNGFERSYFATQNARQISRTEGVMELTADM